MMTPLQAHLFVYFIRIACAFAVAAFLMNPGLSTFFGALGWGIAVYVDYATGEFIDFLQECGIEFSYEDDDED